LFFDGLLYSLSSARPILFVYFVFLLFVRERARAASKQANKKKKDKVNEVYFGFLLCAYEVYIDILYPYILY